jgi:site-specific recombinase XerD
MTAHRQPPKPLDRVRAVCRVRHYSIRTEDAYHDWIERFIRFHGIRHPQEMAEPEVNAFLTHLAVNRNVAASTQNQALSALLFLYSAVLDRPLNQLAVVRANRPKRLPVVLTRNEVKAVLCNLVRVHQLLGRLLYGTGMRLLECLRLRVKDVDFALNQTTIREGKGDKDPITVLPALLQPALRNTK